MPLYYGNIAANSVVITEGNTAAVPLTVTVPSGQTADVVDISNALGALLTIGHNSVIIGGAGTSSAINCVSGGTTVTINDGFGDIIGPATVAAAGSLQPGNPGGGTTNRVGLLSGSGVPNNANGNNGDVYFRQDGGAGTAIYQRRAGSWVATAA